MKYLTLVLFLPACAFKQAEAPPSPAMSAQTLTIRWKAGEQEFVIRRTLQRSGETYEALAPVTLSNPVPSSLQLEGSLGLTGSAYVESAVATRDGQSFTLAGNFKAGNLEVSGLRSILSDDKDQRADLLLRARDSGGGSPWVLKLSLMTLPSQVSILPDSAVNAPRKLIAPNLRLDLLRPLRIRNDKPLPLAIVTSGRWLKGYIERRFTRYSVVQHQCSHEQRAEDFTISYPTSFVVLPVHPDLSSSFLAQAFDGAKNLVIPAIGEVSLALYGSGDLVSETAERGFPQPTASRVSVVVRCQRSECDAELRRCSQEQVGGWALEGLQGHPASIHFEAGSNQAQQIYEAGVGDSGPARFLDLLPNNVPFP